MAASTLGMWLDRFWNAIVRLRGPGGCPWDRAQTLESLLPDYLEELYEYADAVHRGDTLALSEELGDLLLLWTMSLRIAQEDHAVEPEQVMQGVLDKVIRLHPHVFGEEKLDTPEEVIRAWEQRRKKEGKSRLRSLPRSLPALLRAQKVGERAARERFDWPDADAAWEKVEEELREMAREQDGTRLKEETGDLLFALTQWIRLKGWNAELLLQEATDKFIRRYEAMQDRIRQEGRDPADLDLDTLEQYWQQIKDHDRD